MQTLRMLIFVVRILTTRFYSNKTDRPVSVTCVQFPHRHILHYQRSSNIIPSICILNSKRFPPPTDILNKILYAFLMFPTYTFHLILIYFPILITSGQDIIYQAPRHVIFYILLYNILYPPKLICSVHLRKIVQQNV